MLLAPAFGLMVVNLAPCFGKCCGWAVLRRDRPRNKTVSAFRLCMHGGMLKIHPACSVPAAALRPSADPCASELPRRPRPRRQPFRCCCCHLASCREKHNHPPVVPRGRLRSLYLRCISRRSCSSLAWPEVPKRIQTRKRLFHLSTLSNPICPRRLF